MTQCQSQVNVLEKPGTNLLSIREFARICRVTPRTIRFYDQKDLLKPRYIDEWTKYRYYDPLQARDFLMIKFMQNFHIPLSQIKLNMQINSNNSFMTERIDLLKIEIEERQKEVKFLENLKSLFFEDKNFNSIFKKENVGPYYLFGLKIDDASYDLIPKYRLEVKKVADELGFLYTKDIVFYPDFKFKPKHVAIEFYVICTKDYSHNKISLPKGYYYKNFSKLKTYAYDYIGPELYLIIIYQRLFSILVKSKLKIANYYLDINVNSKDLNNSPYDFESKLVFPIK